MTITAARRLKYFGVLLMSVGVLLLVASIGWNIEMSALTGTLAGTRPIELPPSTSLSDARAAIPKALDAIYKSLNDGDPTGAARYLPQKILQSTNALDFICRPFTFRGYYIEAMAARPDERFQARVRVLFKPLDERAHTMMFHVAKGQPVLEDMQETGDDWWNPEKEEAKGVVRRFVYALKAGRNEIAMGMVSPNFPFSKCIEDVDVQKHLARVAEVQTSRVSREQDRGIKIVVGVEFPEFFSYSFEKLFSLERIGGEMRIVRAFYPLMGLNDPVRWPQFYEDPEIEQNTLKRFGLAPSRLTAPVVLTRVQPEYTEEARTANFSGTVFVWLVVGENGTPGAIRIDNSPGLGLDEKIVEAVKQWKFKPAMKDGQPIAAPAKVEITFQRSLDGC
jgi:TonB family protein